MPCKKNFRQWSTRSRGRPADGATRRRSTCRMSSIYRTNRPERSSAACALRHWLHGWMRSELLRPLGAAAHEAAAAAVTARRWTPMSDLKPSQPISAHAAAELGEAVQTLDLRACPNCSVPVEKDGGCDHMRCRHCWILPSAVTTFGGPVRQGARLLAVIDH